MISIASSGIELVFVLPQAIRGKPAGLQGFLDGLQIIHVSIGSLGSFTDSLGHFRISVDHSS
jgi:hypothetical protein